MNIRASGSNPSESTPLKWSLHVRTDSGYKEPSLQDAERQFVDTAIQELMRNPSFKEFLRSGGKIEISEGKVALSEGGKWRELKVITKRERNKTQGAVRSLQTVFGTSPSEKDSGLEKEAQGVLGGSPAFVVEVRAPEKIEIRRLQVQVQDEQRHLQHLQNLQANLDNPEFLEWMKLPESRYNEAEIKNLQLALESAITQSEEMIKELNQAVKALKNGEEVDTHHFQTVYQAYVDAYAQFTPHYRLFEGRMDQREVFEETDKLGEFPLAQDLQRPVKIFQALPQALREDAKIQEMQEAYAEETKRTPGQKVFEEFVKTERGFFRNISTLAYEFQHNRALFNELSSRLKLNPLQSAFFLNIYHPERALAAIQKMEVGLGRVADLAHLGEEERAMEELEKLVLSSYEGYAQAFEQAFMASTALKALPQTEESNWLQGQLILFVQRLPRWQLLYQECQKSTGVKKTEGLKKIQEQNLRFNQDVVGGFERLTGASDVVKTALSEETENPKEMQELLDLYEEYGQIVQALRIGEVAVAGERDIARKRALQQELQATAQKLIPRLNKLRSRLNKIGGVERVRALARQWEGKVAAAQKQVAAEGGAEKLEAQRNEWDSEEAKKVNPFIQLTQEMEARGAQGMSEEDYQEGLEKLREAREDWYQEYRENINPYKALQLEVKRLESRPLQALMAQFDYLDNFYENTVFLHRRWSYGEAGRALKENIPPQQVKTLETFSREYDALMHAYEPVYLADKALKHDPDNLKLQKNLHLAVRKQEKVIQRHLNALGKMKPDQSRQGAVRPFWEKIEAVEKHIRELAELEKKDVSQEILPEALKDKSREIQTLYRDMSKLAHDLEAKHEEYARIPKPTPAQAQTFNTEIARLIARRNELKGNYNRLFTMELEKDQKLKGLFELMRVRIERGLISAQGATGYWPQEKK